MFKTAKTHGNTADKGNPSVHKKNGGNPFFRIQTKLSIGKPDDSYEREADSVADKIVQKAEGNPFNSADTFFPPNPIQKKSQEEKIEEIQKKPLVDSISAVVQLKELEDETLQKKCEDCENEEKKLQKKEQFSIRKTTIQQKCEGCENEEKQLQKKALNNNTPISSRVEQNLKSTKGGGTPLTRKTKIQMEHGFGANFSNVRIHNNSSSVKLSKQLGAQAFTTGNDVYFNAGKYNPTTKTGKHLLAHELTHVIQQSKGANNPIQRVCENSPSTVPTTGMTGCSTETSRPTHQNTEINYVVGNWKIDPSGLAAISGIAAKWHTDARNDTIRIDGFASCDGATSTNWKLSCDRANAVENELKHPSDGSPGIPATATFNKFAHGETEEFSTVDQTQNRKSLVTLQPTAAGLPTTMPTAGPSDFVINRIPGSDQDEIFFEVGKSALTADALLELDMLKMSSPGKIKLIGYTSMEEPPALAKARAIVVRDYLKASPNALKVKSAKGNPGATSTRSDFARARSVEIVKGKATSKKLDCKAKDGAGNLKNPPTLPCPTMDPATLTAFNTALPIAKDAMTAAINASNAAHADFNPTLVQQFFGKNDAPTLATLAHNLSRLEAHVISLPGITKCGGQCDTGGCESGGVIAYNNKVDASSTMTLCVPTFKGLNTNDQARNLIHESAHGTSPLGGAGAPTEGTKDVAYRHERLMFQLSPEDRLRNSDSYALFALFAKEVKTTGNQNAIPAGILTPSTDNIVGITGPDLDATKLAVAQLEKRVTWASDHTNQLFGEAQKVKDGKQAWADTWAKDYMQEAALRFPVNDPSIAPNKPTMDDMTKLAAILERYKMMRFAVKRNLTIIGLAKGVVAWPGGTGLASDTLFIGPDFFRADPRQQISLLVQALAGATPDIETQFIPAYVSFAEWIHDHA